MSLTQQTDAALLESVTAFLFTEARLLDGGAYREWQALLSEDITYQIPLRTAVSRKDGTGFDQSLLMNDTWATIDVRIRRLTGDYAWAEDPPSRMRHFITNIEVERTDRDDEVRVQANVLLFRTARNEPVPEIFSARRKDVLRSGRETGWLLARRTVLLDHTVIAGTNLPLFF
ncbi:MAG: aromatic-ring-hydroxylating dioxygenase subunit beta [Candidatus Lustribacter sp.]|jgi:3-phenylpropionate/cinnamic acid dioxygenase small subunit